MTPATLPSTELILEHIDKEPQVFERMIVQRMLFDRAFTSRIGRTIFHNHAGQLARGLSLPVHKTLARVAINYHHLQGPIPLASDGLWFCLSHGASQAWSDPNTLQADWQVLTSYIAGAEPAWPLIKQYTNVGFTHWLRELRCAEIIQNAITLGSSSDSLQKLLQQESAWVSMVSETEQSIFGLWEGIWDEVPDIERFKTSLTDLNARLGGGIGRGEGCLVIGSTNSGKTVLSTQLCSEFLVQGKKGAYITTERTQGRKELERRIVSQNCRIPYTQVADGMGPRGAKLGEGQRKMLADLMTRVNHNHLQFVEWWKQDVRDITIGLRDALDKVAQKLQGLDFVVFDWIGGGRKESQDPAEQRMIWMETADAGANIVHDFNCAGVFMAQGNVMLCRNNALVDNTCLAECKAMDRNFPCTIGISYLLDKTNTGDDPTRGKLMRDQFLNVAKTRRGIGGPAKVAQDFGYQRFTNR